MKTEFMGVSSQDWSDVVKQQIRPWVRRADDCVVQMLPSRIQNRVGELYSQAVERYPTYEMVVLTCFCAALRSEFGDEENASQEAIEAFQYARERYGYRSPQEEAEDQARDREEGICSHGLTWLTCPCGCFEF